MGWFGKSAKSGSGWDKVLGEQMLRESREQVAANNRKIREFQRDIAITGKYAPFAEDKAWMREEIRLMKDQNRYEAKTQRWLRERQAR